jgi:hypothetical protein
LQEMVSEPLGATLIQIVNAILAQERLRVITRRG